MELPDPTSDSWRIGALQSLKSKGRRSWCREYLRQYLPLFAERGVAAPAAVRFRIMQSRWGSCSGRTHSLSFNARLCERPHAFIEYVVVHELCHFLHGNHSADFGARWSVICRTGRRGASSGISGAGWHLSSGARKKQGLFAVGRLLLFVRRGLLYDSVLLQQIRACRSTASWTSSVTP